MAMQNKLKQFLEARKITTYQLVKDTGIASSTGYNLSKDPKHLPSTAVLKTLCDTYKVQPSEFLEWLEDYDQDPTVARSPIIE